MALRDTLRKAARLPVEPTLSGGATRRLVNAAELDQLHAQSEQEWKPSDAWQAPRTVDQIVREMDGPNLDEIEVSLAAQVPNAGIEGKFDFAAIYQQSGLPAAAFTAEQMLEMLASMPLELPLDTKRQTVKATLNTMGKTIGATPETIVADASRKLAALTAYVENLMRQTCDFMSGAEREIAELQALLDEKRQAFDAARQKQTQMRHACDAESHRLDEVLEFFSLDVPPSKYAPPGATKK